MNSKEQIAFLKEAISLLETQNGIVELTGIGIDSGEIGVRTRNNWAKDGFVYTKGNLPNAIFPNGVNWNLFIRVESMDIPSRAHDCLANANVQYVGEVIQYTETELLRTRNFGRKSMYAIRNWLRERNLDLGMMVENWPEMLASVGLVSGWRHKRARPPALSAIERPPWG